MLKMGRWMEVLKKMMHHHTFTLFPISGGWRGVSVSVISKFLHGPWDDSYVKTECVCVCVSM